MTDSAPPPYRRFTTAERRPPRPKIITGKQLTAVREKQLNVSIPVLADLLGVDPRRVRRWEDNEELFPRGPEKMLMLLVKMLDEDCTVDELRVMAGLSDAGDSRV